MDKKTLLINQFKELYNKAYYNNTNTFSSFHGELSLSTYEEMKNTFTGINTFTYGGYDKSERKIVCFIGNGNINPSFPIKILKIEVNKKEPYEELTHRDYLGALLSLGIDKSKIGDIIIKERSAYVIISEVISNFVLENLNKIRHSRVDNSFVDSIPSTLIIKKEKDIILSSLRADNIVSILTNLSRCKGKELILCEKVFVNGLVSLNPSKEIEIPSSISIKGFGRFELNSIIGKTRKSNYIIKVKY